MFARDWMSCTEHQLRALPWRAPTTTLAWQGFVLGAASFLSGQLMAATTLKVLRSTMRGRWVPMISNSWGYASGAVLPLNVVNAINSAAAAGVVVVFAMSNSVEDNCGATPDISSLDSVIAASTATNLDRLLPAGFGTCMDLLAPTHGGTLDAVTTDRVGDIGYNNRSPLSLVSPCASAEPGPPPLSNQDYTFCFGGTSFPHRSSPALQALFCRHKDSLTRLQVQNLLQDTADKIFLSGRIGADWIFLAPGCTSHARIR